jgi:hypothetical protein
VEQEPEEATAVEEGVIVVEDMITTEHQSEVVEATGRLEGLDMAPEEDEEAMDNPTEEYMLQTG